MECRSGHYRGSKGTYYEPKPKGTKITRRANKLRFIHPRSLFCLVEFDDNGYIYEYHSGKGYEGIPVDVGNNHDGEERMVMDFDRIVQQYGRAPVHVTIITAASPCNRVCAGMIEALAMKYHGQIKTWTILYHAQYMNESNSEFRNSMSKLNQTLHTEESDTQMMATFLHHSFIDPKTLHK